MNIIFWAMLIIAQMSKNIALNTRPQKSESCDEDEVIRLSDHRSNIGGGVERVSGVRTNGPGAKYPPPDNLCIIELPNTAYYLVTHYLEQT